MSLRDIWAAYEGAWNETDVGRRAQLLRQTLDEGFIYSDPLTMTVGHEPLSSYIGELQKSVPGVRIVTSSFEQHHDACLVKWTMQDGQSRTLGMGSTCAELGGSGRLKKATAFYDPLAS